MPSGSSYRIELLASRVMRIVLNCEDARSNCFADHVNPVPCSHFQPRILDMSFNRAGGNLCAFCNLFGRQTTRRPMEDFILTSGERERIFCIVDNHKLYPCIASQITTRTRKL